MKSSKIGQDAEQNVLVLWRRVSSSEWLTFQFILQKRARFVSPGVPLRWMSYTPLLCRSLFSCKNIIERLASTKIFRESFVFKFMVELSIAVKKWTVYDTYKCRIKIKLLKDLLRIFFVRKPSEWINTECTGMLERSLLGYLEPRNTSHSQTQHSSS